MAAANTSEAFSECIGKTIKGVIFTSKYSNAIDSNMELRTFVFDDGTGITIASNGSFWPENKENILKMIAYERERLNNLKKQLAGVLKLAGEDE